jgi:hypothetical protein
VAKSRDQELYMNWYKLNQRLIDMARPGAPADDYSNYMAVGHNSLYSYKGQPVGFVPEKEKLYYVYYDPQTDSSYIKVYSSMKKHGDPAHKPRKPADIRMGNGRYQVTEDHPNGLASLLLSYEAITNPGIKEQVIRAIYSMWPKAEIRNFT